MKLIVGLGNPGKKYEKTRHNLGFMVIEELVKKLIKGEVKWEESEKFNCRFLKIVDNKDAGAWEISSGGEKLVLVKPQTYMNNSGMAVSSLITNYQLPITNLWVIHDDLDVPLGRIKIAKGKGTAGHHGVISIVEALGTTDFVRFRLGIGHSKVDNSLETLIDNPGKFVLEAFLPQEADEVRQMIKQTLQAIEVALKNGVEKAMTRFNH